MNTPAIILGASTLVALGLFAWQGQQTSDAKAEAAALRVRLEQPSKSSRASDTAAVPKADAMSRGSARSAALSGGLPGILAEPDPLLRIRSPLRLLQEVLELFI